MSEPAMNHNYGAAEDYSDQIEGQPSKFPYVPLSEPSAPPPQHVELYNDRKAHERKANDRKEDVSLEYDDFEAKLVEFYSQYNKDKLPDVPRMATEWVTRQEELWRQLRTKYPEFARQSAPKPQQYQPPYQPPPQVPQQQQFRPQQQQLRSVVQAGKLDAKLDEKQIITEPGLLRLKSPEQIEILYRANFHWTRRFRACFPSPCGFCCYDEIKARQYIWVMENRIEENNPFYACGCCCLRDSITVMYYDSMSDLVREPCCTPYHFCCCLETCGGVAAHAPSDCVNNICCPCYRHYYPCLLHSGEFVQRCNSARAQFPLRETMC